MQFGKYIVKESLGKGGFCEVFKGVHEETGQEVAIKKMKYVQDDTFNAEVNVFKNIGNHPNIIGFVESGQIEKEHEVLKFKTKEDYMILELCKGGEFFDHIANNGKLDESTARKFFNQILNGVQQLHQDGFTHRDLKLENVLLDEKLENVKICDFGFATRLQGENGDGKLKTVLGSMAYMAPELHAKAPYCGKQVDVFALGVMLFIMVTGKMPFGAALPSDPFYKAIACKLKDTYWKAIQMKFKSSYSEEFKDLVFKMIQLKPEERLTTEQIQEHPWIQQTESQHQDDSKRRIAPAFQCNDKLLGG